MWIFQKEENTVQAGNRYKEKDIGGRLKSKSYELKA